MENIHFIEITKRYFRGQLKDDEYDILTEYLKNSENKVYFEQIKHEWTLAPELDDLTKSNLNRLQFKLSKLNEEQNTIKPARNFWLRISGIAAITLIGIFSGFFISYLFNNKNIYSEPLVFETPRGEKSMVKLPDGSQVWLNANSRLVYKAFSFKQRSVELIGEAFFKIAHNEDAPFTVKTNECEIEVLGTTFNVMAYDEFGRKEITLLEGKVNILSGNRQQILKPGQAWILQNNKTQIMDVNTTQASGWVDNKFIFKNIPLSELIKRLENWYDVDIILDNKSGKEVNFTGTFKNEETIWQVLEAIKIYTPIEYEKTQLRNITIIVK